MIDNDIIIGHIVGNRGKDIIVKTVDGKWYQGSALLAFIRNYDKDDGLKVFDKNKMEQWEDDDY